MQFTCIYQNAAHVQAFNKAWASVTDSTKHQDGKCENAKRGDECWVAVSWAMTDGIYDPQLDGLWLKKAKIDTK